LNSIHSNFYFIDSCIVTERSFCHSRLVHSCDVKGSEWERVNVLFMEFKYGLNSRWNQVTNLLRCENYLSTLLFKLSHWCGSKLQVVADNKEYNKPQCQWVNYRSHFISHLVCCQILQYHQFHASAFIKNEDVSKNYLEYSLQVEW
jgi:hypothetical protein